MKSAIQVNSKAIEFSIPTRMTERISAFIQRNMLVFIFMLTIFVSSASWFYFSFFGYQLAYNDAMSHLAIARRVNDNITPGIAQLGSVWLPFLHVLMLPTVWIDWFWRTGLSGAVISMASFMITSIFTYKTIMLLTKKRFASFIGMLMIITNLNLIYLQTTALTEPLFIALLSLSMFYLVSWAKSQRLTSLILVALFVSLSTLTRYDGWLVFLVACASLLFSIWYSTKRFSIAEGKTILFAALGGLGVVLWFLWNQVIFGDALYFVFGEYSARSQQVVLATVKDLPTLGNALISISAYVRSIMLNIGIFTVLFGVAGWILFMLKRKNIFLRSFGLIAISPILFNISALYLGHSVLHIPGIYGDTWFNIRYGLIMLPWAAVFTGYLLSYKHIVVKTVIPLVLLLQTLLYASSGYLVTLEDGLWGSSRKNVKVTGRWLESNLGDRDGLILASVSSHDAILFASGLPMKRFIHEGTGDMWKDSLLYPDQHAQFIIMRTHDHSDYVTLKMDEIPNFSKLYEMIYDDEFADVYQLKNHGT